MNSLHEKLIATIKRVIRQYDGIFDPTKEQDSQGMAEHIVRVMQRNFLVQEKGKKKKGAGASA